MHLFRRPAALSAATAALVLPTASAQAATGGHTVTLAPLVIVSPGGSTTTCSVQVTDEWTSYPEGDAGVTAGAGIRCTGPAVLRLSGTLRATATDGTPALAPAPCTLKLGANACAVPSRAFAGVVGGRYTMTFDAQLNGPLSVYRWVQFPADSCTATGSRLNCSLTDVVEVTP